MVTRPGPSTDTVRLELPSTDTCITGGLGKLISKAPETRTATKSPSEQPEGSWGGQQPTAGRGAVAGRFSERPLIRMVSTWYDPTFRGTVPIVTGAVERTSKGSGACRSPRGIGRYELTSGSSGRTVIWSICIRAHWY